MLAYDRKELVTDEQGKPVTRWDGRTMKTSTVTGEDVPDETERTPVYRYVNPRKAEWPKADYVVGNPPFIGGWKIRQALGDGYVEALWSAYDDVPEKTDFVMYWWDKTATEARAERIHRFGLITTIVSLRSSSDGSCNITSTTASVHYGCVSQFRTILGWTGTMLPPSESQ